MEFKPLTCGRQAKVRFLVVDDSVFARKTCARWCKPSGRNRRRTGDGIAAIAEYANTHPDIVLMTSRCEDGRHRSRGTYCCATTPRHASSWLHGLYEMARALL